MSPVRFKLTFISVLFTRISFFKWLRFIMYVCYMMSGNFIRIPQSFVIVVGGHVMTVAGRGRGLCTALSRSVLGPTQPAIQ